MELSSETITSDTINKLVNVVENMTLNTEDNNTNETKSSFNNVKNNPRKRRAQLWEYKPAPRRNNADNGMENEKLLSGRYTPTSVAQMFLKTSSNPKLFSAKSIDVLNSDDFNTRTTSLIATAEFVLSELHIDPYTRMAGHFHIRNVRTLRDNLMNRMRPALVFEDAKNNIDRDTLITYATEMDFINTRADGLVGFINGLAN